MTYNTNGLHYITQPEATTMNEHDEYMMTEEQIEQLDNAMREYFELERMGNEALSQSIRETQSLIQKAIAVLCK